jgi:flagellar basal body-associated protein FliL
MSETEQAKPEEKAPKKGLPAAVTLLVTAVIAGGGAFGGAKLSAARAAGPAVVEHVAIAAPPPGPTVTLEPFVLVTPDTAKKMHAMKVSLAVEFEEKVKEDTLKSFTPRIRDATLNYLRGLSYEDAVDSGKSDKLRTDLLERFRAVGAVAATRVLITDLVVQ